MACVNRSEIEGKNNSNDINFSYVDMDILKDLIFSDMLSKMKIHKEMKI